MTNYNSTQKFIDNNLDNSPVFFTGLVHSKVNSVDDAVRKNSCNKTVNDCIKSSEFCNSKFKDSINSKVLNQTDGVSSQSFATSINTPVQASHSNMMKKTLLPSPDSPFISTELLLETLEFVKALNNTNEKLSNNLSTPYEKQDLKWKSKVKTQLQSKCHVSPYPSRADENRQSSVKFYSHPSSTPDTRNGRHDEKYNEGFETPCSSRIPSANNEYNKVLF